MEIRGLTRCGTGCGGGENDGEAPFNEGIHPHESVGGMVPSFCRDCGFSIRVSGVVRCEAMHAGFGSIQYFHGHFIRKVATISLSAA